MPNRKGYRIGMPSSEYWELRGKETLSESFANAVQAERYIKRQYRESLKRLIERYNDLLSSFVVDGEIDVAKLNTAIIYNKSFAGKVRRLEKEIELMANQLTTIEQKRVISLLTKNYKNTIISNLSEFKNSAGLEILNTKAVEKAVMTPWTKDGREFSQRIWGKNEKMNKQLRKVLSDAINNGESIDKTTRKFRQIMNNSTYNANRIIRTETLAIYNRASLASYKELGVRFVQIIDNQSGACEECAAWNGNLVAIDEVQVGVNVPPRHPFCKGRIKPVII